MTPKQRIRRIQRWLTKANGWHPSVYRTHVEGRKNTPVEQLDRDRFIRRLARANRLFAAELAWVAKYALQVEPLRNALYVARCDLLSLYNTADRALTKLNEATYRMENSEP